MLDIEDVMTKQIICIRPDTTILEAVELMAENDITGIPVVEDDMTLVGVLSDQDVLRLFHNYDEERDTSVSDFMTQPAIHFEQNELLSDVCHCLMENSIRRVPITSNGRVVGVISRSDILKCILRFSREITVAADGQSG